jgi:phosphoglycerate-specific signal transduction histidine kinase
MSKHEASASGLWRGFSPLSWLSTIRSRLYLAFALAAAMTVICSTVVLIFSTSTANTLNEIVSRSMPATIDSFRLSDGTSRLIALAPRLIAVEDEAHRAEVSAQIGAQSRDLQSQIERLRALDAGDGSEIAATKAAMDAQLNALKEAVADRISGASSPVPCARRTRVFWSPSCRSSMMPISI